MDQIYIIYTHGNSSDLSDSVKFIEKMCMRFVELRKSKNGSVFHKHRINFVVFDYSGYGYSRVSGSKVSEDSLCVDLEMVLAWVNKSKNINLNQIILWGFSLGTYPVSFCGAHYPVKACILQSPLASISHFAPSRNTISELSPQIPGDYLSNIKNIGKIKSQLLVMHSLQDQIIPFSHAVRLIKKYHNENAWNKLQLLQVSQLKHNQMHMYLCTKINNPLQQKFIQFIERIISNKPSIIITDSVNWDNNSQIECLNSPTKQLFLEQTKESQAPKKINNSIEKLNELYQVLKQIEISEEIQLSYQFEIVGGIRKQKIKNINKNRKINCKCFQLF